MSITATGLKIFAAQHIQGGGNQSPKRLAKEIGCPLVDIRKPGWENEEAEYQVWYMNDDIYRLQGKDFEKFERILKTGKDIKIVSNFVIGGMHKADWIIKYPVSKIIFLNRQREDEWKEAVRGTLREFIPTRAILPPIEEWAEIKRVSAEKIRIGRHSRISLKYPDDPCSLYEKLNREDREFSFMVAHPKIVERFPHFKYYSWNEKSVKEFLEGIDIYIAIINPKTKEQGGRSNMEAMMAGCCVIVEDRDGPRDYIKNGETGFLVKSEEEAVDIMNGLTRIKIWEIGERAREYALNNFKIQNWIKEIC